VSVVAAGTPAPDFTLRREDHTRFTREDLLGRTSVLVFYPFAFSAVCSDQLNLYEEVLDRFAAEGATLYGVSCDSTEAQRAFKQKLGITIEQLSDWEP
jgi:peroxiredoxin (alkyl hydroperoxide reductase subunit C)